MLRQKRVRWGFKISSTKLVFKYTCRLEKVRLMNDCCGWLQQLSVLGPVLPEDVLSHTGTARGWGGQGKKLLTTKL